MISPRISCDTALQPRLERSGDRLKWNRSTCAQRAKCVAVNPNASDRLRSVPRSAPAHTGPSVQFAAGALWATVFDDVPGRPPKIASSYVTKSMLTRHIFCGFAILTTACSEPPRLIAEGEHVVVWADETRELCGGSVRHMDDFIRSIFREFALSPPDPTDSIQFYWLEADEVRSKCSGGETLIGCTRGRTVYSMRAPHNHELVHAIAYEIGTPKPFLREGLAVMYEGLGGELSEVEWQEDERDVRILLGMSTKQLAANPGNYRLAGAFSAMLIETYGLDAYLDVYASLTSDATDAEVEEVFLSSFGDSLDSIVGAFGSASIDCSHRKFDAKLMECSAPEIVWNGAAFAENRELSCEQDDVIGPFGDGELLVLRNIELYQDGNYELRMAGATEPSTVLPDAQYDGGPVLGVSIYRCGGCSEGGWLTTRTDDRPRQARLKAGRYVLRLHGRADARQQVGFSFSRIAD